MRVHLGGHLSWYDARKRSRLEMRLEEPLPLLALVQRLGIPPAEIGVAAVNGAMASLEDAQVSDQDQVDLLPPVGGGSVGLPAETRRVGNWRGCVLRRSQLPRGSNARADC